MRVLHGRSTFVQTHTFLSHLATASTVQSTETLESYVNLAGTMRQGSLLTRQWNFGLDTKRAPTTSVSLTDSRLWQRLKYEIGRESRCMFDRLNLFGKDVLELLVQFHGRIV